MADRRMLARTITDNDNFVSLSAASQALYMHLTLSADDDGFCNQVSTAMFRAHAKKKDLEALVEARYLLRFDSGVMVIKHWRMANAIRKDRYAPTVYQEEYKRLTIKDNLAYTMATTGQTSRTPSGNQTATNGQPSDANPLPQVRLGKDSNTGGSTIRAHAPAHTREDEPEDKNDLGRVMDFFMDRINPTPSPMAVDDIKGYTETLGADVVIHALGIALDERKTGWSYIHAILQRYERDGLKTMDAVLRDEQERTARKAATPTQTKHEKPSQVKAQGFASGEGFKDMDALLTGLEAI